MEKFESFEKRGYLDNNYEIFYLKDQREEKFRYHHHDFYKVILFISGKVTYFIEGISYDLKPGDILILTDRDLHMADISKEVPYERIVLWFKPSPIAFEGKSSLLSCFEAASSSTSYLLTPPRSEMEFLEHAFSELLWTRNKDFMLINEQQNALFTLILVYLNRIYANQVGEMTLTHKIKDEFDKLIESINDDPSQDFNISELSSEMHLSRYTLMHKFKKRTGFTLYSYVIKKRLILASKMISLGKSATESAYNSGFSDYSSFAKAFKSLYGVSPGKFKP